MRVAVLPRTENSRARDKGVNAGAGNVGDVGGVHTPVYLEPDAPTRFAFVGIQLGARLPGLGQRAGDEFLAAEAWIDAHEQDDVDLV